jgi:thiol-disulfide isomerase/thioredoxin
MLLFLVDAHAQSSEPARLPPETVLLFVASWCAPCHGELARLPQIARSARPYRVLVVAFDDSRATRAMLAPVPAAQRWQPDRTTQRRLAAEVERRSAGLPFSLATDRGAGICAAQAEALDAAQVAAMVATCRK